jgi:hypothetical protein
MSIPLYQYKWQIKCISESKDMEEKEKALERGIIIEEVYLV